MVYGDLQPNGSGLENQNIQFKQSPQAILNETNLKKKKLSKVIAITLLVIWIIIAICSAPMALLLFVMSGNSGDFMGPVIFCAMWVLIFLGPIALSIFFYQKERYDYAIIPLILVMALSSYYMVSSFYP